MRKYDVWFFDSYRNRSVTFDDIERILFLENGAVRIMDRHGWGTDMSPNEFDKMEIEVVEDDTES